ncbi:Geranylgeranyl transferase type-1 subunit beta [Bienertia sinuspersici]
MEAEVRDESDCPRWRVVGIYGWPEMEKKCKTWELVRAQACMDAFKDTLDACQLRDLGYKGNKFTWQRGKDPSTLMRKMLDRFVGGNGWVPLFSCVEVRHLPIYRSDHAPILLTVDLERRGREGGSAFTLNRGVRLCYALSEWASSTFGSLKKRDQADRKELKEWQGRVPDAAMLTVYLCVGDLINGDLGTWNMEALHEHLNSEDARLAASIPLSSRRLEDVREEILNCATIMWAAWAFRNYVVFNEPWGELQQGVEGFSRLIVPSSGEWRPPAAGNVKVNVDCACLEGIGTGVGAVIRDANGELTAICFRRFHISWRRVWVRPVAARFGVKMETRLGLFTG